MSHSLRSLYLRSVLVCALCALAQTEEGFAQKKATPKKATQNRTSAPTSLPTPPPVSTTAIVGYAERKDSLANLAKPEIERLAAISAEDHIARAQAMFILLRLEQYSALVKNFDTLFVGMKAPQLEMLWNRTRNIVGEFRGVKQASSERVAIGDVVTLETQFQNSDLDIIFSFGENHKVIGFAYNQAKAAYILPQYATQEDIEEREVTVKTGKYELPGLLALPSSTKQAPSQRVPIALLLHDMGPQNKDRKDGGYRLNKDFALGLGKQGIATLRYDKRIRLYALSSAEMEHYTVQEETITDAASALELIRSLAKTQPIDTTKIFIIAPTLAAMVVPRILRTDSLAYPHSPRVAGAVMLALNYRKLYELMMPRFDHFFAKDGLTVDEVKQQASIKRRLETVESTKLNLKTSVYDLPYGIPASYWLDLRSYNHVEAISNLTLPMLLLYGQQDHDVEFADNALPWKEKFASKSFVEWKAYPNLFHFFATGNGSLRDYDRQGNVDAEVITDIAQWITKR